MFVCLLSRAAMSANVSNVDLPMPHAGSSSCPLQIHHCRPEELSPSGGRGVIFVTYGNAAEVALVVFANHTIDQVKAEIAALFGIPSHLQNHCYRYWTLGLVIPLKEHMMFVQHLFIDKSMVLKDGFSFGLVVHETILNAATALVCQPNCVACWNGPRDPKCPACGALPRPPTPRARAALRKQRPRAKPSATPRTKPRAKR